MNGRAISLGYRFRVVATPQIRAAFSGLGRAVILLVFVILATALKFTARVFLTESAAASLGVFAVEAAALGAALLLAVPLIVAACNLGPSHGGRRLLWLAVTTPLAVFACVASPLPRLLTGHAMEPVAKLQLGVLVLLVAIVVEFR